MSKSTQVLIGAAEAHNKYLLLTGPITRGIGQNQPWQAQQQMNKGFSGNEVDAWMFKCLAAQQHRKPQMEGFYSRMLHQSHILLFSFTQSFRNGT